MPESPSMCPFELARWDLDSLTDFNFPFIDPRMRRSKRIAVRSNAATRKATSVRRIRNLLDLPQEFLVRILSMAVTHNPAYDVYTPSMDHMRLRCIAQLSQVCRLFRDILFACPSLMQKFVVESRPGETRFSRYQNVMDADESSFLAFFQRIACRDAIRTVVLDYEWMISLTTVFGILDCPNLENLSLQQCSGFSPQDFLRRLREWTAQRLLKKEPLLCLKEVNLSQMGEWNQHANNLLWFIEESAGFWKSKGASFVLQTKKLFDSVSRKSVSVKPAICEECLLAVVPFEVPSCSKCHVDLDPVCEDCRDYEVCKGCQRYNLGDPKFLCQDCPAPFQICETCEEWFCLRCRANILRCRLCEDEWDMYQGTGQCVKCGEWFEDLDDPVCSVCDESLYPPCWKCLAYKKCYGCNSQKIVCKDCVANISTQSTDWLCNDCEESTTESGSTT